MKSPTQGAAQQAEKTPDVEAARRASIDEAKARRIASINKEVSEDGVVDTCTYHANVLITWSAFTAGSHVVWRRGGIWRMLLRLGLVSLIVAVLSAILVPNPQALSVSKFTDVSLFLRVFVGLLLGFFLSSSMNKWYACAMGFLELFDAIRNLQMQFVALGCRTEKANLCMRYGVVSAHLLNMQLLADGMVGQERRNAISEMWSKLRGSTPRRDGGDGRHSLDRSNVVVDGEEEILMQVDDPSSLIWVWVGSLLGRMAQDGEIPAMQTPTYGRLMQLAQNGNKGIRSVREAVSIQPPFIYVHMLATLVHINNILNAISFGFTMGTSVGVYMANANIHLGNDVPARDRDVTRDFQDLVVCFFFCMVGPMIYQALLEIGIVVAKPFAHKSAMIPTQRMLDKLSEDLKDGLLMADLVPFWEKPFFQQKP